MNAFLPPGLGVLHPDELTLDQWVFLAGECLVALLVYLALCWWVSLVGRWRLPGSIVVAWAALVVMGLALGRFGGETGLVIMAALVVACAPLWVGAAVGLLSCWGGPADARRYARNTTLVLGGATLLLAHSVPVGVMGLIATGFAASIAAGVARWRTAPGPRQRLGYPR